MRTQVRDKGIYACMHACLASWVRLTDTPTPMCDVVWDEVKQHATEHSEKALQHGERRRREAVVIELLDAVGSDTHALQEVEERDEALDILGCVDGADQQPHPGPVWVGLESEGDERDDECWDVMLEEPPLGEATQGGAAEAEREEHVVRVHDDERHC